MEGGEHVAKEGSLEKAVIIALHWTDHHFGLYGSDE